MSFKTIRGVCVDKVELEMSFTALCPLDKGVDNYTLKLVYTPRQEGGECIYIEFFSFKAYLDSFKSVEIYHEDLARRIADDIVKVALPEELMLVLTCNHRGVKVSTIVTHKPGSSK